MRVLLISANTEQINMPVLPVGMGCVAAAAQNKGHEVKMINLMTQQQDSRKIITEAVNGFYPEIIGISVRNIDDQFMASPKFLLESVKKIIAECRDISNAPIVLGGAGYSIFPKSVLAYLKADMGIQGEGEAAFVMLLERLDQKADISDVPGLYLPESGLQKKNRFKKNLDEFSLPIPNIHLTMPSDFKSEDIWIPFQTRRGCPMNCLYCSTATIEGRIIRKRSPKHAVEGLRQYVEAGFDHFFFVDNTFNFPPSYAKKLCEHIIKTGLKITWRCILYPWKADDDLIEIMARAGCKEVSLGFESGSEKILRRMNKRFLPEDVCKISESLKKQGIHRMGFLLLGVPDETRETVEKSLHFADSLKTEGMKISTGIRIYPYTPLSKIAIAQDVIKSDEELLFPKFYVKNNLKDWLLETVNDWMKDRPHWVR